MEQHKTIFDNILDDSLFKLSGLSRNLLEQLSSVYSFDLEGHSPSAICDRFKSVVSSSAWATNRLGRNGPARRAPRRSSETFKLRAEPPAVTAASLSTAPPLSGLSPG